MDLFEKVRGTSVSISLSLLGEVVSFIEWTSLCGEVADISPKEAASYL